MSTFSFLPADDPEVPDLEAALAADEADALIVVDEDTRPEQIGKSWKFDFQLNEFTTDRQRGPLATFGMTTLQGWIEKCLRTDRGAHPIHPPEYGMQRPFEWFGHPVGHLSGDIEDRIRDALTFHPRISDVVNFDQDFDPNDDWVTVEFTVVLDNNTELRMAVTL